MAAKQETKTKPANNAPSLWRTDSSHIRVRSPNGQRWRAQRRFTEAPSDIAKSDLSEDEALLIQRDELLTVEEIEALAT